MKPQTARSEKKSDFIDSNPYLFFNNQTFCYLIGCCLLVAGILAKLIAGFYHNAQLPDLVNSSVANCCN